MVAAGEVDRLGAGDLEAEEQQDDLHRKAAAVHKVAVEDVRILRARHPVLREDRVDQVVKLAVHITADGDLRPGRDRHLDNVRHRVKQRLGLQHDRHRILVVQLSLAAEAVDQPPHKLGVHGAALGRRRPSVPLLHHQRVQVDAVAGADAAAAAPHAPVALVPPHVQSLRKALLPQHLFALGELRARVPLRRQPAADLAKVLPGARNVAQRKQGGAPPVQALGVGRVERERVVGVVDRKAVLLQPDAGHTAVRQQHRLGVRLLADLSPLAAEPVLCRPGVHAPIADAARHAAGADHAPAVVRRAVVILVVLVAACVPIDAVPVPKGTPVGTAALRRTPRAERVGGLAGGERQRRLCRRGGAGDGDGHVGEEGKGLGVQRVGFDEARGGKGLVRLGLGGHAPGQVHGGRACGGGGRTDAGRGAAGSFGAGCAAGGIQEWWRRLRALHGDFRGPAGWLPFAFAEPLTPPTGSGARARSGAAPAQLPRPSRGRRRGGRQFLMAMWPTGDAEAASAREGRVRAGRPT